MSARRPVLILQLRPEDDTSDNEYAAILKYGGLHAQQTRRLRIERTGIPPLTLTDYSAVIVGGSPFDISTPQEKKSAIQRQIESDFMHLLDEIVGTDFPFLGACSGNGLLGAYLGMSISTKFGEAVGCTEITLTEDGYEDPLLDGFPDKIWVLLGHKEACDQTPTGATLLMRGESCPVQMFRVGNNVYATQFHPEGDSEGFILRINAYKHHGYFKPEQADSLIEAVSRHPTPFAQLLLRRFVQRYAE